MRARTGTVLLAIAVTMTASACSSSGSSSSDSSGSRTVTVAYQKTSSFPQLDSLFQQVKPAFEKANPGVTIKLEPIEAQEDQYYTKLALMNGSADTAPDVIYEDTFQVMSDAAAGYLMPIDDYVGKWSDWSQFDDAAQKAGLGVDGKNYGVSMGTDTRGIYFNKQIFAKAGLPADWQPKTWQDIITAAQTVQAKVPGVIPLNIYSGKAAGEATTMQGFEMLYYGAAPNATLYDTSSKKWISGSKAYTDSLNFYKTVADDKLGPPLATALDAAVGTQVNTTLLPQGKLAIAIDGSWLPGNWISGANKWDGWQTTMGLAKMPTQDGSGAGFNSMSGGWLLSVGAHSKDPQDAFNFIAMALNKDNTLTYDTTASQIAVRKDVAADPKYLNYNSSFGFFSGLVQYTHFRPATPDYSQISSNIQAGVESVITGQATPTAAAQSYDQGLTKIVGQSNVQSAS